MPIEIRPSRMSVPGHSIPVSVVNSRDLDQTWAGRSDQHLVLRWGKF